MNELMSDKGDCRTAPATPGLLKIELFTLITSVDFSFFLFAQMILPKYLYISKKCVYQNNMLVSIYIFPNNYTIGVQLEHSRSAHF